jgi:hypothetical protein
MKLEPGDYTMQLWTSDLKEVTKDEYESFIGSLDSKEIDYRTRLLRHRSVTETIRLSDNKMIAQAVYPNYGLPFYIILK